MKKQVRHKRMTHGRALRIISFIACFGLVFSGTLTYQEFFGRKAVTCLSFGSSGTILGYPACVYGFLMFLVIAGVSAVGWFKDQDV